MPTLDSGQQSLIASGGFAPAFLIYCNFSGDQLRVTTFGADQTFASTGDADLDGHTFTSFDGRALDISDVTNADTGSDTLTVTLSGIVGIDASLLADIATRSIWQGQDCRLWLILYDVTGTTQQGAVIPYYTGKMSSVHVQPGPKTASIVLTVENYLNDLNDASNRSYLNQSTYDSADVSAAATMAAANGARRLGTGVQSGTGGGSNRRNGGRVMNL